MIPLDSHDPRQVASSPAEGQFHTLSEPRDPMRRGISPNHPQVITIFMAINSGWWLTYPSEKYESQLGWFFHSQYGLEPNMFQTTRTLNHPHFGLVYGTGFPTSKRYSGEIRIQNALNKAIRMSKQSHLDENIEERNSGSNPKDIDNRIVECRKNAPWLSAKLLPHLCWCDKFKSPELLKVTAPSRLWANPKWLEESTLGQHTFFNIDWCGRHRRHPIFRSIAADQATKALAFPSFSFWKVLVPTGTNHSSLFRKDTRRCMTSCVSISIHFHPLPSFLKKVVLTILKNDGVRQWEGWHPIYIYIHTYIYIYAIEK